ncbi:MAG: TerC family protein [Proteobacteria bacterium]|nr:TerC family protein [Pseudomonadota bacterium]NOG60663.1 TerC family protein [Pseudomonadota bacterium]
MFELITNPEYIAALLTLIALEIVLGIDNIVFISILVGRLPEQQRNKARRLGLAFAMLTRLALLFSLVWIMGLINPLFTVFEQAISGRDIILIIGGLFLLVKSTHEIHNSLEIVEGNTTSVSSSTFMMVLVQIAVLDVVFSLDSVITAVGLVDHVSIMVIAIVISVIVMMFAAKPIGEFIDTHPTFKILALSFLLLIGVTLMVEGFDVHVPKGYIYFAMAFSIGVEILNIKVRKGKRVEPIQLNKSVPE